MQKEELKRLKKKLETKVYIEDIYNDFGPVSVFEIEEKIDTLGAIENIEKYFQNVIKYFSSKNIKYDEIILKPLFSVIVKEKDLDNNTIIRKNSNPMPGIVVVRINGFYCKNKDKKIYNDPDQIYSDNFKGYIVVYDDFIKLLENRGFDFSGFNSIEEIKNEIILGKPTISDIKLSFNKNKVKKKV